MSTPGLLDLRRDAQLLGAKWFTTTFTRDGRGWGGPLIKADCHDMAVAVAADLRGPWGERLTVEGELVGLYDGPEGL